MKTLVSLLMLTLGITTNALAHAGHGHGDPHGLWHQLGNAVHSLPLMALIVVALAGGTFLFVRKMRAAEAKKRK